MIELSLTLIALAALLALYFGVRYLRTRQFMPYHAVVAGRAWDELEPGVQTIVRGMLRIIGGAFVTYGFALLWLLVPLSHGEPWAHWAILTVSAPALGPTLYVTLALRKFAPTAKTPVVPASIAIALVLAGVGASWLA
ncbi:MAG: hypothetical protein WCA17_06805 [Burkholderiales bacterium]